MKLDYILGGVIVTLAAILVSLALANFIMNRATNTVAEPLTTVSPAYVEAVE